MSRVRIHSASQTVFTGPAPATGYNFINISGIVNNDYFADHRNYNLLQYIDRVNALDYGFSIQRQDVKELGRRGIVERHINVPSEIDIGFAYYQVGVKNELRLGLNCDYARFDDPYNGQAFYGYKVCPVSGITVRNLTRSTGEDAFLPYDYRDKRNLYAVIYPNGEESLETRYGSGYDNIEQFAIEDCEVIGFGGCYLNSYKTNGAVGAFPISIVRFSADNMVVDSHGSGIEIPAVDTKTRELITGVYVNIPQISEDNSPSVILQGDITLDIKNADNGEITDLGINFVDIPIQSYDLGFDIPRQNLNNIGYKLPLDKKPVYPLYGYVSLDMIIQDNTTGNVADMLKLNKNYNLTIKLKNPLNYVSRLDTAGKVCVQYDILGAKIDNIKHTPNLNSSQTVNIAASVEIDLDDFTKGLFISGLLNMDNLGDYLISDIGSGDSFVVINNSGDRLLLNTKPIY